MSPSTCSKEHVTPQSSSECERQDSKPQHAAHDLHLLAEIKEALSNWHDLLALRKLPLADRVPRFYLLAARYDRGLALRSLLQEAIDQLKPPDKIDPAIRAARLYYVVHLRYIEGYPLQEIQSSLSVSRSELYRLLDRAIAAMADYWLKAEQTLPSIFVNPEPIPRLPRFVGRERELALFRKALAEKHLAVICGMPGVGKSSLAAELVAGRDPNSVLWIKFTPGRNTTLESLLEDLAQALAARGQQEYLLFLHVGRQKTSLLSINTQARYLVSLLAEGHYTVCLDDCHVVDNDPLITSLGDDLWRRAMDGQIDLVIMSRASPRFARQWNFPLLKGMNLEEARQLLNHEGLEGCVSESTLARLHLKTGGAPMFLHLFAAWVKEVEGEALSDTRVAERVRQIENSETVQTYLLREVESMLTPEAARVATIAAALRGDLPLGNDDFLNLLAAEGVTDIGATTQVLQHSHLVTLQVNNTLTFHPLVKAYFYTRLARQAGKKKRMHRQLACFCKQQREWVEAIYHCLEAGESESAARLVSERVEDIINVGQARTALELLKQLDPFWPRQRQKAQASDQQIWREAWLARGQLHALVGEYEQAIHAYTKMMHLCTDVEQWAHVHQRMGDICQRQSRYDDALAHYGEGMILVGEASAQTNNTTQDCKSPAHIELAQLQHSAGQVHYLQGKYTLALELCEKAVRLFRIIGYETELAKVYNTLCAIYRELGNYTRAIQMGQESLALTERVGHVCDAAEALYNIAIIAGLIGHYREALGQFERALELIHQVGDVNLTAKLFNGLGIAHCWLENWSQAAFYLQKSLAAKERLGDQHGVSTALSNLGYVYGRQANYTAAIALLKRALSWYKFSGRQPGIASIDLNLAEIHYCRGQFEEALDLCSRSRAFYQETGLPLAEVSAMELIGRVYLARGEDSIALEHLLNAKEISTRLASLYALADVDATLAEVHLAMGETDEACRCAQTALELADRMVSQRAQGNANRVMGEVWGQEDGKPGDREKAEEYLRCSVTLLEEAGTLFELGLAYRSLGQFLQRVGQTEEGQTNLQKARDLFERIGAQWELERTKAALNQGEQGPVSLPNKGD